MALIAPSDTARPKSKIVDFISSHQMIDAAIAAIRAVTPNTISPMGFAAITRLTAAITKVSVFRIAEKAKKTPSPIPILFVHLTMVSMFSARNFTESTIEVTAETTLSAIIFLLAAAQSVNFSRSGAKCFPARPDISAPKLLAPRVTKPICFAKLRAPSRLSAVRKFRRFCWDMMSSIVPPCCRRTPIILFASPPKSISAAAAAF